MKYGSILYPFFTMCSGLGLIPGLSSDSFANSIQKVSHGKASFEGPLGRFPPSCALLAASILPCSFGFCTISILNKIKSYSLIVLGLVNEGVYYVLIVLIFVIWETGTCSRWKKITTCVYIGYIVQLEIYLIFTFVISVGGGHLMKC